jgi:hypothetical protein
MEFTTKGCLFLFSFLFEDYFLITELGDLFLCITFFFFFCGFDFLGLALRVVFGICIAVRDYYKYTSIGKQKIFLF